ncbi:MAG: hypothetical protein A2170_06950 [Deltaproteobacteria bacterium RBG_13_53_10]|nr:MAG: hypothetical protein A2170_06950 [Deltaproteobacteria bacterium RBG_13_53_10]
MKMPGSVCQESPDRCLFPLRKDRPIRSVAVIHQGALGDFILSLPVLEGLRDTFPSARVTLIGYPRILELAVDRFYAEEGVSVDRKGMASFFMPGGPLDASLSRDFGRMDLIAVFGKDPKGALAENLRRVSQGEVLYFESFPPEGEGVHVIDHLAGQFVRNGFHMPNPFPRLFLSGLDRDWANEFWGRKHVGGEERSKAIVFHPGSGSVRKVWPLAKWSDLARLVCRRYGRSILVVLGPAEAPEAEKAFDGIKTAKDLSLLQLASVLEGCGLFIGNDSGVSHMAAALGVRTVAIFGPTDPKVWSPRGEKVHLVRKASACSPCSRERLVRCEDLDCLKSIEPEDVLECVEKWD